MHLAVRLAVLAVPAALFAGCAAKTEKVSQDGLLPPPAAEPFAPPHEVASQEAVMDMKALIAHLRNENEELRGELQVLKYRKALAMYQAAESGGVARDEPAVPKGATPHDFNGETFYVIPLNKTANRSTVANETPAATAPRTEPAR